MRKQADGSSRHITNALHDHRLYLIDLPSHLSPVSAVPYALRWLTGRGKQQQNQHAPSFVSGHGVLSPDEPHIRPPKYIHTPFPHMQM